MLSALSIRPDIFLNDSDATIVLDAGEGGGAYRPFNCSFDLLHDSSLSSIVFAFFGSIFSWCKKSDNPMRGVAFHGNFPT